MAQPTKIRPPKTHERAWHEGTVKEVRPGVWRAWRERVRQVDGKTLRPSRTFRGEAAEQRAKTWAKGDVEPTVLLLGHWLDRWLALRLPIVRPQTQRNYREFVKACAPLVGRPLADVTTDELQALTNALLGRWSRSHVAAWRSIISSSFKSAVPRHRPENPMLGVKLPTLDEKPVKAWSGDELTSLVEAARGYKHEIWFWLSIGTGLRMGESRCLLWSDVDLANKLVTVSKSIDIHTDVVGPTKSGKTRIVDLPDELVVVLANHARRQQPGEIYVCGSRERRGRGRMREPHDPLALRKWLLQLCARAGVTPLPPHSTRHTFATLSLEAGVPLKEVSEALGHANVAITAKSYSHAVEQRRRRAANAIGAALTRRPGMIRELKPLDGTQNGTRGDA